MSKEAASTELIREKATQLKRLLIEDQASSDANSSKFKDVETATRRLCAHLDEFFNQAQRKLERRRVELLAALDRQAAAAAAAGAGSDRALLIEAEAAVSADDAEMASGDLLRRLNESIALRKRSRVNSDAIDVAEAERRALRLLACLQLDWISHGDCDLEDAEGDDSEWRRQRRADDPFCAPDVHVSAQSSSRVSAYGELPVTKPIDFSHVLSPSGVAQVNISNSSPGQYGQIQAGSSDSSPGQYGHIQAGSSTSSCIYSPKPAFVTNSKVAFTQPLSTGSFASAKSLMVEETPMPASHETNHFEMLNSAWNIQDGSYCGSSVNISSSESSEGEYMTDVRTVGAPKSLTYIHGIFYTVEGGCIRKYRWQDGQCMGKLSLEDEDGCSVDVRPFCVRSCSTNDWLLIVDNENSRILCVDSDGTVRFQVGPRVSARYSLDGPEQAVSNGSHLFICCSTIAIFIVRICDGRSVTQKIEHLGLTAPIRLAWSHCSGRLVVLDNESDDAPFTLHTYAVTGCGTGGLARASIFGVEVESDHDPDIICLPESDRLVLTCGKAMVKQMDSESFYDSKPTLRTLCVSGDWKLLSDICVIHEDLVAVSDKRAKWIRILETYPSSSC